MKIHFASPYSLEGNLGKAYNETVEKIGSRDWICLLDLDVMLLGDAVGHQLAHIVATHSDVALFTCFTNRVGTKQQRYPGMWGNPDLRAHRQITQELQKKHYDEIQLMHRTISGHLMLFNKETWKRTGGFTEKGILGVDYDFSRKVMAAGKTIALMTGVYATHYYRMNEGRSHVEHLKRRTKKFFKEQAQINTKRLIKVLVVIANYGSRQLGYLEQIVTEYRNFDPSKYDVDIVVHSNIYIFGLGLEVKVIKLSDYQLLPYSCRKTIWDRKNAYDFFIYSENDILVRQKNIEAYLKTTDVLPLPLISGFVRYERCRGELYYPELHKSFGFDPDFVHKVKDYTFAYLTNEHSAMFCLTKMQLEYIASRINFTAPLCDPLYQNHTMKVQCCTSLYNSSGLKKVIPISHLKDFSIHHLSNKYSNKWNLKNQDDIKSDINRLLALESMLDYTKIIRNIIKKYKYRSYLEIGCNKNHNFNQVALARKVGVDPVRGGTHKMTSDAFFDSNKESFDIIFIDGLHEEEQVMRDILNSLNVLNAGGTVVVHDLLPASEVMQEVPRKVREWTGDCWKAWVRLRSLRDDLEMFVIDTDYGVGIIREGGQETISLPNTLNYESFNKNKTEWLNVVTITEYFAWLLTSPHISQLSKFMANPVACDDR